MALQVEEGRERWRGVAESAGMKLLRSLQREMCAFSLHGKLTFLSAC